MVVKSKDKKVPKSPRSSGVGIIPIYPALRIQVCPKKGINPTILFCWRDIGPLTLLDPEWVWILRADHGLGNILTHPWMVSAFFGGDQPFFFQGFSQHIPHQSHIHGGSQAADSNSWGAPGPHSTSGRPGSFQKEWDGWFFHVFFLSDDRGL